MLTKTEIKELIERVHNNQKLSSVEDNALSEIGLEIVNDGAFVELKKENNVLASIKYFTVGSPSDLDWKNFDKQIENLNI